MQTATRYLPVKITLRESEAYGKELAACLVEKGKLEEKRKEINAAIKPYSERAECLSKIVDSGEEQRSVECQWDYNWAAGTRTLFRQDTGEEVDHDIIPEHERQQRLELEK